jgi:hypothetical protein
MTGMIKRFMPRVASLCVPLLLALPLAAQIDIGDRHYAERAESPATHIEAAIAAYRRAAAGNDLEAHWKLLRAYRFKGAYVAKTSEQKKAVYAQAKEAGEKALALVAARGVNLKGSEKAIAAAARNIPGAAETFLWDAVNWGEWALAYGKMAAARQGAADRIRRGATVALLVNPALEGGAPARVLGRLHDQTPRIPFITGWASGKEAVRFLNESLAHDPDNKLTLVFLAEAMVSEDASKKPQAIAMLKRVVAAPNHAAYAIEDAAATADAKALLAKW